ncbi:(Fe-S)-binding protein [Helicobacter ailurogastricus]|uniref:Predicted L-lactate dehydrogenase, Fe-S oxidoreductase subunit YkgE n=1 Tax=Helicobacter ailurogastricus TaxID=1578720 RepID=A0A0K2Y3Y5_9HELI|nr:(Fe-S)-binding protein [Helicobacter ailurogastricus]CRI32388.1 Predicted L-lactate dehydrogenase, Fe-S oxidoreductase subunit YkgE [Helicobacter ailurogastricus]
MKVYFFATCLGGAVFSQTALNCIKLLQREGVEVIFKKDQTCCGQPSYNSGYYEQTRQIVLHNVRLFKEDYPVIVPSGSCVGMMAHDYLELFEGHKEYEEVKNFASRVFELSEFLDKKLEVRYTDTGAPIKVTWHSNCHALRVSKVIESAKKIIAQLSNVELVPLQREEECCGFGGTFAVKEPEISNAMVQEKIHDIESRQVQCVLSADAGCLLNISGAMAKMNSNTKAMHFYDFLAQRVGLGV